MNLSQGGLAALYLWSFLLGACFGGVYDVLRITRVLLGVHYSRRTADRLRAIKLPLLSQTRRKKESPLLGIVIFLEDLFFCLFVASVMILLFYGANHGKLRFPAFLLAAVGFLLYRASLGRTVMTFSEVIAFFAEVFIRYVIFFAGYPIRISCRVGKRFVGCVWSRLSLSYQRMIRRRYTGAETAKISKNACGLIPDAGSQKDGLKRGKQIVRQKQKTIQSNVARSYVVGRSGRHVVRHLRE